VAYIRTLNKDSLAVGFLLGKAKVAPSNGHTIPRLELWAAVIAVELAEITKEPLNFKKEDFHFYSDSSVVLHYISAETRRFHVNVANRVSCIRLFRKPEQWKHVPTDDNPADIATRKFATADLSNSMWLIGHSLLRNVEIHDLDKHYLLVDADSDREIKTEIVGLKTTLESVLGSECFTRYSTGNSLVRALSTLKRFVWKVKKLSTTNDRDLLESTEKLIIREVQYEAYSTEVETIRDCKDSPKHNPLLPLSPILDGEGILCVGGRISRK
jgi:hypothetical protein